MAPKVSLNPHPQTGLSHGILTNKQRSHVKRASDDALSTASSSSSPNHTEGHCTPGYCTCWGRGGGGGYTELIHTAHHVILRCKNLGSSARGIFASIVFGSGALPKKKKKKSHNIMMSLTYACTNFKFRIRTRSFKILHV